MSIHRSLAAALWVLAAAAVFAIGASWAADAQDGKLTPWALVALFWGAALVSVLIHYLAQGPDMLRRGGWLPRRPQTGLPTGPRG